MLCCFNPQSSFELQPLLSLVYVNNLVVTIGPFPLQPTECSLLPHCQSGLFPRLTLPQAFDRWPAREGPARASQSGFEFPLLYISVCLQYWGRKASCVSEFLLRIFPVASICFVYHDVFCRKFPLLHRMSYFTFFLYSEKSLLKSSDFKCSHAQQPLSQWLTYMYDCRI